MPLCQLTESTFTLAMTTESAYHWLIANTYHRSSNIDWFSGGAPGGLNEVAPAPAEGPNTPEKDSDPENEESPSHERAAGPAEQNVTPLIHAVRKLLPSPRSTTSYSGVIGDFALFFDEVDLLASKDLDTITSCFERQLADTARIASIHANDDERLVAAFEITEHGSRLAVTSQWQQHLQKKSSRLHAQDNMEQSDCAGPILDWLYSTNIADHPRQSFPGDYASHSSSLL
ncbi:MAG: hypothetical protein FRX49_10419 [Trebouxia sp. A1-2]|nr:MAG: hypothetical protein FRX49_10419 [Trebouxia sp. A1-2]